MENVMDQQLPVVGDRRRPGRPGRRRPPRRARPATSSSWRPATASAAVGAAVGARAAVLARGGTTSTRPPGALLEAAGWVAPDPDALPTGGELVADYLAARSPTLPRITPHVRYGAPVAAIARLGLDRVRTAGREADAVPDPPRRRRPSCSPRAVIDASGTWRIAERPLGGNGIPAHGETDGARRRSSPTACPTSLGARPGPVRRPPAVGRRRRALRRRTRCSPWPSWPTQSRARRCTGRSARPNPARAYGGGDADALPARGAIGTRLRALVDAGRVDRPHRILRARDHRPAAGSRSSDGRTQGRRRRIVNATGFRPDHTVAAELRLDLDPILGSTRALAPLIDPNEHSCGTVPPHGVDELAHPEPGFYAVGAKSLRPRARRSCSPPATSRPAPSSPPSPVTGTRPATSSSTCPRPVCARPDAASTAGAVSTLRRGWPAGAVAVLRLVTSIDGAGSPPSRTDGPAGHSWRPASSGSRSPRPSATACCSTPSPCCSPRSPPTCTQPTARSPAR